MKQRTTRRRNFIERLVGADVHPGEWTIVILLIVDLFVLLTAYYVLKVVREPLILINGGAVSRSYARGTQAVVLLAAIPAYGALANRVDPSRLVNWITGFFAACLVIFPILSSFGVSVGFVFFVWLGIFSTLAIAQFWSLANDLFTEDEGKRLFPLVATGGTVGAIVGSQISARAIGLVGPLNLMLIAAAMLIGCIALTTMAHRRAVRARATKPAAEEDDPLPPALPGETEARGGFSLVLRDPYLLLIGLAVVALNLVNTSGDYILAEVVNRHATALAAGAADPVGVRERVIGTFYGDFQTAVSILTALIQIFLVARTFKLVGIRGSLFILPFIAVSGYGLFALIPLLGIIYAVKVIENSTDYSLQNTIQQALFLPTSRDAKYKGKATTDTFFVRVGDLASTGLVFVGVHVGLGIVGFSLANLGIALVWVGLAALLARGYRRISKVEVAAPRRAARASVLPVAKKS
jgi:AAA family ATP:ADP antiporter